MHRSVGLPQFPLLLEGIFGCHHCNSQHFIHVKAVGLRLHAGFMVALPMVRKRFPSLCAQFLWFHTKNCMGVLIGFVELGIIV
jgi:hypothetical protein